jgi:hypothetical protein
VNWGYGMRVVREREPRGAEVLCATPDRGSPLASRGACFPKQPKNINKTGGRGGAWGVLVTAMP